MPIKTDSNHPRVYIIAPYSLGDREYNVRRAIAAAETLLRMGFRPFVPILSHYWHLVYPHSEEEWSDLDMYWLEQSDLVAVVPGKSIHGEIEIAHAQILNLPILYLTEKECTPPEQR